MGERIFLTPPRYTWRATQRQARNLDRAFPRWWDNKEFVSELLDVRSERVRRCFIQHIRQRRGY